jgi:hypothetical protein
LQTLKRRWPSAKTILESCQPPRVREVFYASDSTGDFIHGLRPEHSPKAQFSDVTDYEMRNIANAGLHRLGMDMVDAMKPVKHEAGPLLLQADVAV